MKEGVKIYKYSFLLNERVAIGTLAPDESSARAQALQMFGKDSVLDLCSVTFSHVTGEFGVIGKAKESGVIV
jgi:hypothetical protein